MIVNMITPDDLQAFKEGFLEELVDMLKQQKTTPAPRWLKADDVRRVLKISPHTLQTLREQGTLPYTKIGGIYYYDPEDISRMLEEKKTRQPTRGTLLPGEESERKRRKS
jgi:hypothetical protein